MQFQMISRNNLLFAVRDEGAQSALCSILPPKSPSPFEPIVFKSMQCYNHNLLSYDNEDSGHSKYIVVTYPGLIRVDTVQLTVSSLSLYIGGLTTF